MKNKLIPHGIRLAIIVLPGIALADEAQRAASTPALDPYAVKIIKRASTHLASAKQFSVESEIWQELEDNNGNLVEFSKNTTIHMRRPDKLRVEVSRNTPKRSFFYDGKTLTLQDHHTDSYGQVPAPDTTDAMLEKVASTLGITLPLEDLLISTPFGGGAQKALAAQYLGEESILGVPCHHVAFQNANIQWQAWIHRGAHPLLRKIVLIFPEEFGAPRFTAIMSDWDLSTPLADHVFEFVPPPGLQKIEVLALDLTATKSATAPTEK